MLQLFVVGLCCRGCPIFCRVKGAALTVFCTSSVHSVISPPSYEPEKMHCTKVRDYLTLTIWANHCSWPMRNSHFLLQVLLQGTDNMCIFTSPKEIDTVNIHPESVAKANVLLPLGML
jgi:hypothetical protein